LNVDRLPGLVFSGAVCSGERQAGSNVAEPSKMWISPSFPNAETPIDPYCASANLPTGVSKTNARDFVLIFALSRPKRSVGIPSE